MKIKHLVPALLLTLAFSCKEDIDDTNTDVVLTNLGTHAVSAFAIDKANTLWIGTDTGLFKVVTAGYQLVDIKNTAMVTSLAFDAASNSLWVGTNNGLTKLGLSGSKPSAEAIEANKLSNKVINTIYTEGSTADWFGTEKGLTRYNTSSWQKTNFKKNASGTITPLDFESVGINAIAIWDGDYYFATNGLSLYRTTNWTTSIDAFTGATQWGNPYNGLAITDTMYVVFVDSKQQIWIGGRSGLEMHIGHESKSNNTSYYDELVNPIVHCVAEAADGKIWVGTENGISIFDGTNWSASDISLPSPFVNAIAFDKAGKAYIGTKNGLVVK